MQRGIAKYRSHPSDSSAVNSNNTAISRGKLLGNFYEEFLEILLVKALKKRLCVWIEGIPSLLLASGGTITNDLICLNVKFLQGFGFIGGVFINILQPLWAMSYLRIINLSIII
jgi:hypothetical protein